MAARSPGRSMAGPARGVDVHAELAGDDVGERRLAQAGRAVEQDVVRRLPALPGGREQDREVVLDLRLADVLREDARPEAGLDGRLFDRQRRRRRRSGAFSSIGAESSRSDAMEQMFDDRRPTRLSRGARRAARP